MSGLDKDRFRNQTICFRMSPEERRQLEARIKICGLPKGDYIIKSVLQNEISIVVGKYQSDRLSLELRRLWQQIENLKDNYNDKQFIALLESCKVLLDELKRLIPKEEKDELKIADFSTEEEWRK